MLVLKLLSAVTLGVLVAAHPGEEHQHLSRSELGRRQAASLQRRLVAQKCASAIATYESFRKQRVMGVGNGLGKHKQPPTYTTSVHGPHVTEIKNTTCVTAPETMEGPFYIRNEYVRQDLRDDQEGVKLVLDIGVMDTSTCQPLNNAFVELWAANSTGIYSGYEPENIPGGPPPGAPGGPGGPSHPIAREETFLRGGYFTDSQGIVEITTNYPGYYRGRAAHIHTLVHVDWEESSNGTLVSDAGKLVHVGQLFFEEEWNDKVFATAPYTINTQQRKLNKDDSILNEGNADGAFIDIEAIGEDISEGLYGYITIGVDTTANFEIENSNYNPVVISSLSHGATPSSSPAYSYP